MLIDPLPQDVTRDTSAALDTVILLDCKGAIFPLTLPSKPLIS